MLFVSSRIIVVDLLKHRVPIKQITGFLVYRAHKVLESCQDGFALRLYRLENKVRAEMPQMSDCSYVINDAYVLNRPDS